LFSRHAHITIYAAIAVTLFSLLILRIILRRSVIHIIDIPHEYTSHAFSRRCYAAAIIIRFAERCYADDIADIAMPLLYAG